MAGTVVTLGSWFAEGPLKERRWPCVGSDRTRENSTSAVAPRAVWKRRDKGSRAHTLLSNIPEIPAVAGRTRATSTSASRTSAWPRCGATARPRWRNSRTSCPSCAKRYARSQCRGAQQVCKGALQAPLQCSPVGDQSSTQTVTSKVGFGDTDGALDPLHCEMSGLLR